MGTPYKTATIGRTFGGLMSSMDPHDIPFGAAVKQVNLTCVQSGSLSVRKGMRIVKFNSSGTYKLGRNL